MQGILFSDIKKKNTPLKLTKGQNVTPDLHCFPKEQINERQFYTQKPM